MLLKYETQKEKEHAFFMGEVHSAYICWGDNVSFEHVLGFVFYPSCLGFLGDVVCCFFFKPYTNFNKST